MQQTMDRAWLDQAAQIAQKLWQVYLLEPTDAGMQFIAESVDPQELSLIGTGKHEFYTNFDSFLKALGVDQEESQSIIFEIVDEYYESRPLGVDSCLVFGTLWVREKPDHPKSLLIEMDTRFTMVFHRDKDRWVLSHLHHSMPNADQRRNEYYPKTANEQANEALEYSKILEHRAELDSMTELLNHVAFEKHVVEKLASGAAGSAFFMVDLDDFKQVNDTLGHPAGDCVIVEFSDILTEMFPRDAFVSRMGGDEFAVFTTCSISSEDAEAKAQKLIDRWCACAKGRPVKLGCSVGLVRAACGETFVDLYRAADEALYKSKSKGKSCFSW